MFMNLIQKRRSIRKYQEKAIEPEKIEQLMEAALRPPSSRAFYPWEFVFVTDHFLLEKLSRSKPHGSAFLKDAPLGIVVLADSEKCDVWVEDASIAAIYIQLAAQSIGLSSCWSQIRKRVHNENRSAQDYIQELLSVPEPLKVLCIIAVGYPDEEKPPHDRKELKYDKIFRNYYGQR